MSGMNDMLEDAPLRPKQAKPEQHSVKAADQPVPLDELTGTALFQHVRFARRDAKAGGAQPDERGQIQERAERYLPDDEKLKQMLRDAPLELRVQGETDASLVPDERAASLSREAREAGQVHEDDFRRESELKPTDLDEVRTERNELLRAYFRDRRGRVPSQDDFQAYLQNESEWFRRSPWLEKHLLAPWSVQGHKQNEHLLMLAPRGRARFAAFAQVPQGEGKGSARETLERRSRDSRFTDGLLKARLDVVRAATLRLFSDWEREIDDAPSPPQTAAPPTGSDSET